MVQMGALGRGALVSLVRLGLIFLVGTAGLGAGWAQKSPMTPTATGIAADRFVLAPGPSAFGQVEGAPVAPAGQVWITGLASGSGHPLRLVNRFTGALIAEPVAYRTTLDLGAEVGVWRKRLALGIGIPLAVWQQGDRLQTTGSSNPQSDVADELATTAIGDIRLRAKALLSPPDRPVGAALVVEVTFPGPGAGATNFVATSGMTFAPRLVGWFHKGRISGAVNVDLRFAPARVLYDTTLHNSLSYGAALAGDLLLRRVGLALIAEATGQLNLVSDQHLAATELRGILRIAWWRGALDIGGGGGFGPLTPSWRAFIGLRGWFGKRDPSQPGCSVRPATL